MTQERLDALRAVRQGTVKARAVNAPGTPYVFVPKEQTVALGFLMKAGLIERLDRTVRLTERGALTLSQIESRLNAHAS
jgi:hypothetical protein